MHRKGYLFAENLFVRNKYRRMRMHAVTWKIYMRFDGSVKWEFPDQVESCELNSTPIAIFVVMDIFEIKHCSTLIVQGFCVTGCENIDDVPFIIKILV